MKCAKHGCTTEPSMVVNVGVGWITINLCLYHFAQARKKNLFDGASNLPQWLAFLEDKEVEE